MWPRWCRTWRMRRTSCSRPRLRFGEKFEAYDSSQPFTPWACRFALNKTRQWIERRQRWQALLEGGLAEELACGRGDLRPELDAQLKHLEGCLNKLPNEQRLLVEVATIIGVTQSRSSRRFQGEQSRPLTKPCSEFARHCRSALKRQRIGGDSPVKITFPSREFDEAVAAVCHGSLSEAQARALNELLRGNEAARDDYIFRLEIHSRLASAPDSFALAGMS